jgi:hypothetical protein
MRNDLSLGTFEAGETRELSVSLSVSTDLDTEDMGLTGKVKWVFRTEGDDSEPTDIPQTDTIYPAKTGVMDLAAWCRSGFVLCLAIAIFSLLNLYREKKQNERNDRHHGL